MGVVIQLAAPTPVPEADGDPNARLDAVQREMELLQRDLLEHLDRAGVASRPRPLGLVNAVAVDLTGEEIRSVAQRSDVRRIVLAEPRHVAT
ncbi:hypothetical protein [Pseudonocardia yuanmonensis]|uniref:hypothetical protein n=1 Tax=Pseudonocardia yuanmonensis TaxID=1095914 RepID=UPI0031EC1277